MFNIVYSEDIYNLLRESLLERVRDKETPVRVQAAIALSKLCGSEEDPDEEPKITDVIVDVLTFDQSACVNSFLVTHINS